MFLMALIDYSAMTVLEGAPQPDAFMVIQLRSDCVDSPEEIDLSRGAVPFYTGGCPVVEGENQHSWSMCADCMDSWRCDWHFARKCRDMIRYNPTRPAGFNLKGSASKL
jgi:hypothetical protein